MVSSSTIQNGRSRSENERRAGDRHSAGEPRRPDRRRSGNGRRLRTPARFICLSALFVVVLLGGGSSRTDVTSLIYVRPLSVVGLVLMLVLPAQWSWRGLKLPLALLAAMIALALLQLVPLPPNVWLALPGRDLLAEPFNILGVDQPWQPISMTPDLTLQTILTLLIPLAVFVGMAGLDQDRRRSMVAVLLAGVAASVALGVIQFATGQNSPALLYRFTHAGDAVGFFANRNHHAALLAIAFPLLRLWSLMPARDEQRQRFRSGVALSSALFLLPMIVIAGSRAGLLLGFLGIAAAYSIAPPKIPPHRRRLVTWVAVAGVLLLIALAAAMFYSGRAIAFNRAAELNDLRAERRFELLPLLIAIAVYYLPLGTGLGSFEFVFKMHEPDESLTPYYLNRAHNDLIELVMTAGLPGLLLCLAFLTWWALRVGTLVRGRRSGGMPSAFARAGAWAIGILLIASIVDYPLRIPLMAFVFAVACVWLASEVEPLEPSRRKAGFTPRPIRSRAG